MTCGTIIYAAGTGSCGEEPDDDKDVICKKPIAFVSVDGNPICADCHAKWATVEDPDSRADFEAECFRPILDRH